jgi:hypothetical protein
MTPLADVIVPTHDHALLLPLAVASAQAQTVDRIRIVIVGDGVCDDTRDAVAALARDDDRIVFRDRPKAGRTGEPHREPIVRDSDARIVTYLADDDLLFPDHVETMLELLADADLGHSAYGQIDSDGSLHCAAYSLADPAWRAETLAGRGLVGLTSLSHSVEAYRRLPHGWRATPPGIHTDQYMIRQFLEQPWCRAASAPFLTAVHLPSSGREEMSPTDRRDELAALHARATAPGGWETLRAEGWEALRRDASARHLELITAQKRIWELEGELARTPLTTRASRRLRAAVRRRRAEP